jgi:hypothetical protein
MTTEVEKEVIVEVGLEGGSLALLGVRADGGWRYSLYVNDWTPELLDEEPIQRESHQVRHGRGDCFARSLSVAPILA